MDKKKKKYYFSNIIVTGPSFISDTFISAPKIPVPTSTPFSLNLLLNSSYNKMALSPPSALIYDGLLPFEASPYKVN